MTKIYKTDAPVDKAHPHRPKRRYEMFKTADEAISYAIHEGIVDCGFGACEMAEFLYSPIKEGDAE